MPRKGLFRRKHIRRFDLLAVWAITGFVLFLWVLQPKFLEILELQTYDLRMRMLSSPSPATRSAIVAIDDASMARLGRWPWPRSHHAEVIQKLKTAGAKVIAPAIQFQEPDEGSGLQVLDRLDRYVDASLGDRPKEILDPLRQELARVRGELDHDARLEKAIGEAGNVVLLMPMQGASADRRQAQTAASPVSVSQQAFHVVKNLGEGSPIRATACNPPLERFSRRAAGMGPILFPLDPDGATRAENLVVAYQDDVYPAFSLVVAARLQGVTSEQMACQLGQGVTLGSRIVETDPGMRMFIQYLGDERTVPYFSYADVLDGKAPSAAFRGKAVLIGFTAAGLTDRLVTPLSPRLPAVEGVAAVVENILQGSYLVRPRWAWMVEVGLLLLLGLYCSVLLPRFNATMGALVTLGLFLGTGATISVLFAGGIWIHLVPPLLLLLLAHLAVVSRRFFVTEQEKGFVEEESDAANKMLGLAFQGKGMLDLAFEKFRGLPIDEEMKDILYNLALDFERKRMPNKASSVYDHIATVDPHYKDLSVRLQKIKTALSTTGTSPVPSLRPKEESTVMLEGASENPTLGRYEIVGELGKGAMGIVYKGMDHKIHREVAIKTIRFEQDFDTDEIEDVKKRFFREAETAGRLTHPNIVTIYDVGEDWDLSYIAMELLEGDDLVPYTKKGNLLPTRRVVQIIAQSCDALHYAHEQGVVHRDIKPANIMLLKSGQVKVTDFGIARITTGSRTQTAAGIVLGTPSYMSPEQVSGQHVDGRSDIFALGVVFYELLTGERPFKAEAIMTLLNVIATQPHTPVRTHNPRVPEFLGKVIDKALAKDPTARFQRAGEMARALRSFMAKVDQAAAAKSKASQPPVQAGKK
jgi:eukaryotic-like serine/threonine-protein kinase